MLRSTIRLAPRRVLTSSKISSVSSTRFLSTAPPAAKSRSWKSTFARWGIAIGGIYWYNTSPLFAEEPEASIAELEESIHDVRESSLPTLDAILEEKKHRNLEEAERLRQAQREEYLAQRREYIAANPESAEAQEAASAQEADEDAPPQAFNPETGEINWDCPCLGGMAHGPCGEEFKAAFSCFVFSKEEPKGIECIEKFKVMQTCIRAHPEMYPDREEEDEIEEELLAREGVQDGESAESRKIDEVTETTGESGPNSSEPSKPTPNPYTSGSTTPTTAYSSDKPAKGLVHNAAIDVANQK